MKLNGCIYFLSYYCHIDKRPAANYHQFIRTDKQKHEEDQSLCSFTIINSLKLSKYTII